MDISDFIAAISDRHNNKTDNAKEHCSYTKQTEKGFRKKRKYDDEMKRQNTGKDSPGYYQSYIF